MKALGADADQMRGAEPQKIDLLQQYYNYGRFTTAILLNCHMEGVGCCLRTRSQGDSLSSGGRRGEKHVGAEQAM